MKAGIMQPRSLLGYVERTSAEARAKPPVTDVATNDKAFRTLAAEFALAGFELIDLSGADGATSLQTVYRGERKHLESVDAARALLESIT